nr:hypothetical protein [Tanacetum cinerariifolium]
MNSDPNYYWVDLLDIDDSDLPLTLVLCPCNRHVCETITITSTENTVGIVQVEEVEKKLVRIIPGPAGIVQLAKIRKQSDTHEGRDDDVLSTHEYLEDIKTFLKNGKLEQVVAIIKSCSLNALGDLKVTVKDLSGTLAGSIHYKVINKEGGGYGKEITVGSARILEEEIVKLVKEEEMADLELHVCGNVIDQEDLYKFVEEALDFILEKEAMESKVHEEWLKKCRQQEEEDAEHERQVLVEAAFALKVDAMGALDLVEVEAVRALNLMVIEVIRALDLVELEPVGALDLVEVGAVGSSSSFSSLEI